MAIHMVDSIPVIPGAIVEVPSVGQVMADSIGREGECRFLTHDFFNIEASDRWSGMEMDQGVDKAIAVLKHDMDPVPNCVGNGNGALPHAGASARDGVVLGLRNGGFHFYGYPIVQVAGYHQMAMAVIGHLHDYRLRDITAHGAALAGVPVGPRHGDAVVAGVGNHYPLAASGDGVLAVMVVLRQGEGKGVLQPRGVEAAYADDVVAVIGDTES